MPRLKDSGRIDLAAMFLNEQRHMLASLACGDMFEHPVVSGQATELRWLQWFQNYLPTRYAASSAFIVDADQRRSRQIDIAVYDRSYSHLVFHNDAGPHLPAEAVYAVFEVKHLLSPWWLRDAGRKIATVRRLRRTSVGFPSAHGPCPPKTPPPILAGILAADCLWTTTRSFTRKAPHYFFQLPPEQRPDFACTLHHGACELPAPDAATLRFAPAGEALIFFYLRLVDRLRALGTTPAPDLHQYLRHLPSSSSPTP